MLFSVFSVFVDIEDLDFPAAVIPARMLAKTLFKFLNVFVVEVIVVSRFLFVIRESDKAVVLVERGVKYTPRC